ncbi:MAG: glycosyltransferase family 39 protein [Elusimicrobia bacterium]|nr:glycosyltransferase family 39 protein [Candidatus Liberimonas magnetica]
MTLTIRKIVVFALILRLAFVFITHFKAQVTDDAKGYDTLAVNLVENGEFAFEKGAPTARRTPVYPLVLALVYSIFGHSIITVKILQSLISALTCFLVYLTAKKIFSETTALYSALITSVYPFFIYYCGFLLVETLFTFVLALLIYYSIRSLKEKKLALFVTAGILSGTAVLTRPTAYLLVAFVFVYFIWFFSKDSKTLKNITYMILAFFIVILPWGIRNRITLGNYNFTQSGGMANITASLMAIEKIENGQDPRDLFTQKEWQDGLRQYGYDDKHYYGVFKELFISKPRLFFKHAVIKFCRLWRPYPMLSKINVSWSPSNVVVIAGFALYDIVAVFALIGLYLNRKRLNDIAFLLIPVIAFSLVHMVFSSEPRFNRPVMPFVIILAAYSLAALLKKEVNEHTIN